MPFPRLQLYLTHREALIKYAARLLGSPAQAEDIVQEAWLRFDREAACQQPAGYLYRIVRNLAIDSSRHLQIEQRVDDADEHLASLAAPQHCPASAALYADQLRAMQQVLDRLPPRTCDAFYLHRIEGLTLSQIATQLGISVGLAHQLVREALTRCAECLDE